eukprot:6199847-Pleurochrysis_carterae.AAC.2
MLITSTGAERLFALGRAHVIPAGPSRDDTRAGVKVTRLEKRTAAGYLGVAGDARGEACR